MNKVLSTAGIIALAASLIPATIVGANTVVGSTNSAISKKVSLSDVADHWGATSISAAISKGYVDGYEDGTFKPDKNVSRAEFLKMVATALKLKVENVETGDNWHKAYVKSLEDIGIVRADDFKTGSINTPISRLEMSKIATRAIEEGFRVKEYNPEDALVMYAATKVGLIQGLAKGELALDGETTRAQSVTVVDRILRAEAGEKLEVDKYAAGRAEIALRGTNFESAYGTKSAITLPVTHELTADIKMTIKEIILVDGADKESPYWDIIGDGKREDSKPLENSYIFIYKVEYDMGNSTREYTARALDYFKVLYPNVLSLAHKPNVYIGRGETGKRDAYLIFGVNKIENDTDRKSLLYSTYMIEPSFVKKVTSYDLFAR